MKVLVPCVVLVVLGASASSAFAESECSTCRPWWQLGSTSAPATLPAGGSGQITVEATNLGNANVDGEATPVHVTDKLPAGVEATAAYGSAGENKPPASAGYPSFRGPVECSLPSPREVSCTFAGSLPPFEQLAVLILVKVASGGAAGQQSELSISGGAAKSLGVKRPVSGASAGFGVASYELVPEEEGGAIDTQAGSHPFQLTSTVVLNQSADTLDEQEPTHIKNEPEVPEQVKDTHFALPAGLIGNPTPFPQCTNAQFTVFASEGSNKCPSDTVLGVASVTAYDPSFFGYFTTAVPIFNLEPAEGEPARFGFDVKGNAVILETAVRTGGDYGVEVNVNNITETANLLAARVSFWGVPGSPSHNGQRGWPCLEEGHYEGTGECRSIDQSTPQPFLTMPTSCGAAYESTMTADSWTDPGDLTAPLTYTLQSLQGESMALDGCDSLPFESQISVKPDVPNASTSSGLAVHIHVPQAAGLNPEGLADAAVRDTTVMLPEGVALNPAGANGLEACSEAQVGYKGVEPATGMDLFSDTEPACPSGSKIATVTIKSPLLPHLLEGEVYLATQDANPFGSLVAMYLVAKDPVSGVLVKLPGEVSLNPISGRITSTFLNTPQLPFEELELHFFGGERAPLTTPAHCRTYTTEASFAPWSGNAAVVSQSSFPITSGPNESACPGGSLAFAPSLTGGMTNINAGSFSPLTTTISRPDGQQSISSVQLKMPPGLSGILAGVPLCGEAQANTGTCGAASQIGSTIVSVGVGSDPYSVTGGKVYLTGPYHGAPFGLSIVNPAVAGPFNLGSVVVRAKVEVNPTTAALTVTTNSEAEGYAIPHILDGIPLQIQHVNVTIEGVGGNNKFTFNPTSCAPLKIEGAVNSVEGASSPVSVPFQVANCANLKFAPKFAVATPGHTSKASGAGLTAKLTYPTAAQGTQADIRAVKVDLPKQLPSQLKTLQKACPAKTFEEGFEKCLKASPHSKVGEAIVHTPLLPVPLKGPVIFVSHGGEAFPSLTIVLQGYGVTVDLVGSTFIHDGITSTTFKTVPDVPFNTFELTLFQGEYAALNTDLPEKDHGNLCGQSLAMPTAFVAQNGTEIHESTAIGVSGCPKAKKATKKKRKKSKKHRKSQGGRS